ncbi:FecR family protein [Desertivirga xinjiangensis]|uniref:FecR family protein n=1 Tax=Desertivirga xinjiangensis TaxID=539206 RepID=UPI0021086CF6|nr:FecR domain-containing protein [Pedobacter xinjiangensis]
MSDEKYWNLMSRYVSNELSLEETEELLEWLGDDPVRAELLKELQDTWDKTKNYPENFKVDTRAAWQKLRSTIAVEKTDDQVRRIDSFRWIKIAAMVLLVLTIGVLSYKQLSTSGLIEVETLAGQHKELILPDGSKVWLNSNSSLTYEESFNSDEQRTVKLTGEGFFEIKRNPDKPFIVTTGRTLTQVLGTSFNIKQEDEGNIKVSVVTGKVSFKSKDNPVQELFLLPGDAGLITKEGYVAKSSYEDQNFLFWKNKSLTFQNSPVSQVIKTLEGAYEISFRLENSALLNQRITTSFDNASLNDVSDVLEALLDVKIVKSDSVYLVKKK